MTKTMKRMGLIALTLALLAAMLLPSVALASTSYIHRTLYYGDSGSDVKHLQTKLRKLGFFKGNIGGNYLDLTTSAVKAFERAYGYDETNYCSKKMQRIIAEAHASDDIHRTLHYGDHGRDVKILQTALKRLGYFNGDIGGNYLKKTRAAVKAYQRAYNYTETNYCSINMQYAILGS